MKICIVIPTYNEEKAIGDIVKKIISLDINVLVVDDGSTDKTFIIAQSKKAIVMRNQKNEGKGSALIKGFEYIIKHNYDACITMDGDGQHSTEEIVNFINFAEKSSASIIIGNRMAKKRNMPFIRVVTNKFMSWLISKIIKQKIPDTQCGYRFIRKELLQKVDLKTCKYETESEIIVQAAHLGYKIFSLPIQTIYTGEKSKINPFVDTLRFIRFISSQPWITKP